MRIDTLEEALLAENYFQISLSKIVDILSCSFKGKNFLKAKIAIVINTKNEKFKITIVNGNICNIISNSKEEGNYHFTQSAKSVVPWNFEDKEFRGIGKEIKESVKILERNHKEFKDS